MSGPTRAEPGGYSSGSVQREGQTFEGRSLAARFASFVKLPHTLFALPFAGVGAILASYGRSGAVTAGTILWIVLAFTAARFAAMGFNRLVDRHFDAMNPRTSVRELPSGALTPLQAGVAVAFASAVFVGAAWALNPLCGLLSPLALAWVFFYSFTKRFTAWSHVVLGFALGIAPAGAYLAVTGEWTEAWWALVALAGAVTLWVAGFDIVYSVQDEPFDRQAGLHSMPVRLGMRRALVLARGLHFLAVIAFFLIWALGIFPVGPVYLGGVLLMAVLLHFSHQSLRGQRAGLLDLQRIDRAFFLTNVRVSAGMLLFTLLDRVILG